MTYRTRLSALVLHVLLLSLVVVGCTTPTGQPSTSIPTPVPTTPIAQPNASLPYDPTESPLPPQPTSTAVPTSTSVATAVVAATARPTGEPTSPPAITRGAQTVFSGSSAYEFDRVLSGEIGSRPGGSPAFDRASDYIKSQFEAMGYRVTLQPYTVSAFREKSTRLVVAGPPRAEIDAAALTYSGSGDVRGQLIYCGLGRGADYPSAGVQGKIVLVDRGETTFQSKVDQATSRGASAVVIANNEQGQLRGSLSQPSKIPVAAVLQTDGRKLRDMAQRGATEASLKIDATTDTRKGKNVVAMSTGSPNDRKRVIVGAHYDSVSAGPGANDNGSGVATMLELARVVRENRYPFDLAFVAFGDEEIGLVGSKQFVRELTEEERSQIVAMLNFDMVGVGSAMEFGGDESLSEEADGLARSLGYRTQAISARDNQASDHVSFSAGNIPAVFFYRAEDPNYHTRLDTVDKVLPANLEAAGKVALLLLDGIAGRQ